MSLGNYNVEDYGDSYSHAASDEDTRSESDLSWQSFSPITSDDEYTILMPSASVHLLRMLWTVILRITMVIVVGIVIAVMRMRLLLIWSQPTIRRDIVAVRIYILGFGFRALGRAESARDQVNLHPESESGVKNHPSYTNFF